MGSLNGAHNDVCRWLSERGISYVEEYAAGPYTLDIYIADQRLGVEIDGPQHNGRADFERDALIRDRLGIRIVRIKVGAKKKKAILEAILGPDNL